MAKLKTITLSGKNKADEIFTYDAKTEVTNEGVFRLEIHDELIELANSMEKDYKKICVCKLRVRTVIESNELIHCTNFVKDLINIYIKVEKTEKLVILYKFSSDYSSVLITESGELVPNGYHAEGEQLKDWKWIDSSKSKGFYNRAFGYGLSIFARVYNKTTYTRGKHLKHVFHWVSVMHNDKQEEKYMTLLNSFCHMDCKPEDCEEIEYTEKSADFFYKTILGLCKLNYALEKHFQDKESVLKLVNSNIKLLDSPKS